MPNPHHGIAYFSLEIAIDPRIPTYSGGLGVLAGDTIRAAADLGLPYAGVTLLYRKGYFTQSIEDDGTQVEAPTSWEPTEVLKEMPQRGYVPIEGRSVQVRAYRYWVIGAGGWRVPVYFLDTDLPDNDPRDRTITHALYAGDDDHRIKQAAVLGIAGRRLLRAFTHDCVCFHMNEGHGFLLTLELMSEHLARHQSPDVTQTAIEYVRHQCVFTTHTPVAAGHDRFDVARVRRIVGEHPLLERADLYGPRGTLNTTILALNLSRYANAVSRKHAEVSRAMFPGYAIDGVTNGVHAATWVGPHMAGLLHRHLPDWRARSADLRLAIGIPASEIRAAHDAAKRDMIERAAARSGTPLDPEAFTITFARRATAYKRPDLIFHDLERLRSIAGSLGPIQLIFAGKAHPRDTKGKEILRRIDEARDALEGAVRVAIVPDYGTEMAHHLVAGSDLWLNNPTPPLEASGTSGMKAAMNGVPSLSTLDGWWLEGCTEGVTGWAIEGEAEDPEALTRLHAASLYDKLEHRILPTYRDRPEAWNEIMRDCIALNGSHFTTQRMVRDYIARAYLY